MASVTSESAVEALLKSVEKRLEENSRLSRYLALGPDKIIEFIHMDKLVRMYLPHADVDFIQAHVASRKSFYEAGPLHQVARYITPDSVVLDAGANIGNHMLFFALICGAKQVISVEIMRQTFRLLARNVELNQLDNVTLHNIGLGAVAGKANLFAQTLNNLGGTVVAPNDTGAYDLVTVDSLGLDQLDFMKVDVEGTHLDLLEGARETLRRHRPVVWVELRTSAGEYEPGIRKMAELGYRQSVQLSRSNYLFEAA